MTTTNALSSVTLILVVTNLCAAPTPADRGIIEAKTRRRPVAPETMKQIYEQVKTPHKYGVILKGENKTKLDCPSLDHKAQRHRLSLLLRRRRPGPRNRPGNVQKPPPQHPKMIMIVSNDCTQNQVLAFKIRYKQIVYYRVYCLRSDARPGERA